MIKAMIFAIFLGLCSAANADSIRITADGVLRKYNGMVEEIISPTSAEPATMYFTAISGLAIGGAAGSPIVGQPWRIIFTHVDGSISGLSCIGSTPAFDGLVFSFRIECEHQP